MVILLDLNNLQCLYNWFLWIRFERPFTNISEHISNLVVLSVASRSVNLFPQCSCSLRCRSRWGYQTNAGQLNFYLFKTEKTSFQNVL
jgi:hypothetical protein